MRVAIASRIFDPEPAAASFRLAALASQLVAEGHEVSVLTVKPPKLLASDGRRSPADLSYVTRRWPVLRDRSGYVRGYLQYMSFDVPLFFRVLFGRKQDLIIAEPPPTTGFIVRVASWLRNTPYAYYAADVWADASAQTGAPEWVVWLVRRLELFAMSGATAVLSVSEGVTSRLAELGVTSHVETIGNGVNAAAFTEGLRGAQKRGRTNPPTFVYAGTASEWHGSIVFVEAMPAVLQIEPTARLRFIGGGSESLSISARAAELGVEESVTFEPAMPAAEVAPLLAGSIAALASARPESGYDFAFPTKLYSAAVCGAPLLYSGVGPAIDFVHTQVDGVPLGLAVDYQVESVAEAMITCLQRPFNEGHRNAVAAWARANVSLDMVATRAVRCLTAALKGDSE